VGYNPDLKCYGCGCPGDHDTLGGHYWPCGTMKCSSIRGDLCYEREVAYLRAALEKLANPDGAYHHDRATYYKGVIETYIATAQKALNYPEVMDG
jgi:hypothetical protein